MIGACCASPRGDRRSRRGDRARARDHDEGALRGVARGDPPCLRADARGARRRRPKPGALDDQGREARRRSERRARHQPGRPAGSRFSPSAASSRSISSWPTPPPGKVVRKLTSTATDPHFSSLQFIYSAGAWDARQPAHRDRDGHVGPARAGDLRRAERRQGARGAVAGVDEIFNPTWAPDGKCDLLHRHDAAGSPICSSSISTSHAPAADQRPVRRSAAGLVARRPPHRVCHRPLFLDLATLDIGAVPPRDHRSAERPDRAGRALHAAARTSTRSGRPTAARCTSSPIATAFRICTACLDRRRRRSSRRSPPG